MSNKLNELRFEKFSLSLSQRCLFRGDELVSLTPKEYEILAALLEADGEVVLKEHLCDRLWPDKQVEASNLFHHVRSLRGKLGPREDGQSFIETVPGRGYRLLSLGEHNSTGPGDADHPNPPARGTRRITPNFSPESIHWRGWRWLAALALVTALLAAVAILRPRKPIQADASLDVGILTSPEKVPAPRLLKLIEVGPQPSHALLITKRGELYVSVMGNAVVIVDTKYDKLVDRILVGSLPTALSASADGKSIFVAHSGGGVGVIDISSHAFRYVSSFRQSVDDMVLTPDGKSAYLAAGFLGLAKIDLKTEKFTIISKIVFARALALTPDGRRLYVSYQAKGPGGSFGHDAIGYFDTTTDQFAGAISGFANVGECLTVSPDSSQVWENGADACDSPQYDHVGCPFVPGGLLNIINTSSNKVHAVGVRGARLQCATFSPDGEFAAIGTTDHFMLLRHRDLALIGSLPIGSPGKIAFSDDGLKAYVPVNAKSQVAVIQIGATVRALRLNNREVNEKSVQVAIQSDFDFDAKAIDPSSLRLAGIPVKKRKDGVLDATVEHVTGTEGHSLIVRFNLEGADSSPMLSLVGKTYAGIPIRGTVEAF